MSDQTKVHYFFKLKHNIQNDSELALSKLEIENQMDQASSEIVNFVDVLLCEPLLDFVSNTRTRTQDFITRLPYPGAIQGYHVETSPRDCFSLAKRLAYFRELFVVGDFNDFTLARLLPETSLEKLKFDDEVKIHNVLPYAQIFTVNKTKPQFLLRMIPLHTLYEPSDFICRLAQKIEHVERMFDESIRHVQTEIYRPYSPSSARWFKKIPDFMDSREAPQLYLTHYIFGIHGKFFPRMVGAIINSTNISKKDCILDPFCGSGTMNVESAIRGISSIGVDMQPLFTMITRIKTKSMHWNDGWLRQNVEELLRNIQNSFDSVDSNGLLGYVAKENATEILLPKSYMKGIRKDSLEFVERIKSCINDIGSNVKDETTRKDLQDFCKLPLAYWMRSMLKKQNPHKIFQTYREYLWKMFYSVYFFHKFDNEICDFDVGHVDVYTSDVRRLNEVDDPRLRGEIDGIITSPPYGTAIDYVGDHAWALYMLDLTRDHLKLDEEFHIGSPRSGKSDVNMITEKSEDFLSLPDIAQEPLHEMIKNDREQKASALYKYFVSMRDAFEQMSEALKHGKLLVLIIGKQQSVTTANRIITIELGTIMEEMGKRKPASLEYLSSMDIALQKASERGAIPTEHIIFFKKT
jgi:tRNA G10  N-methylase Trm11